MRHTVRNLFPIALILFSLLLALLSYSIFGDTATQRVVADQVADKRIVLDRLQSQVERSYRLGEYNWLQDSITTLATERNLISVFLVELDGTIINSLDRGDVGRNLTDVLSGDADELQGLRDSMADVAEASKFSRILTSENANFLGAVYPVELVTTTGRTELKLLGYIWYEKDLRPARNLALEQVRLQTLALTLGMAFLALCLGALFHVVVTRRIDKLIDATQRVAGGDLDARVDITSNDEFGVLGEHFNEMLDRRRVVEKALNQTQKLESVGTLASGIAHDFNNILQAISGYTGLALNNADNPEDVRKYLTKIEIGSARAKSLVERILSFSRARDMDVRAVELQSVLRDSIQLIRSTFPSNIRIRVDIDETCRPVLADATQMHQVITNLCTNALHAMEETGGELVVSLAERAVKQPLQTLTGRLHPSVYIELAVEDSGVGIPRENIDRLLDPFFTTKEVGRGTGLGLSIVHGAVSDAGGGLLIDSEPGKGTRVCVLLPRAEADIESVALDELPIPDSPDAPPLSVLLVDDELAITESTALLLRESGCTVHAMNNALDAIDFINARGDEIDVAVFDYMMPDMTGIELAKHVSGLQEDLPVLIASGMLDEDELQQDKPSNVVSIIHKPYKTQALYQRVCEAASRDSVA